jgi:hypothetical protein
MAGKTNYSIYLTISNFFLLLIIGSILAIIIIIMNNMENIKEVSNNVETSLSLFSEIDIGSLDLGDTLNKLNEINETLTELQLKLSLANSTK